MITISNCLSILRAPLAFLFWQSAPSIRIISIFLAMLTDCLDGYIARRTATTTRIGTILDPIMDKFFVLFCLSILFLEKKIQAAEFATMLSRDFALMIYGCTKLIFNQWQTIEFHSIRWGKITTALQFLVLIGLTLEFTISWYIYASFVIMGLLVLYELFYSQNAKKLRP